MKRVAFLGFLGMFLLLASGIFTGCGLLFMPSYAQHFGEGMELFEQGRLDEAIDKFTEAIREEPTWEVSYFFRGTTYCHLGQIERGIEDLNEAIRLDPEFTDPYCNRGFAYKLQGRKAEAIADFEKFISLTDSPDSWACIEMAKEQIEELSK